MRHVPARRAISPAANSLSLRALAGCHRRQLAAMPGCLMGEFHGGCTAARQLQAVDVESKAAHWSTVHHQGEKRGFGAHSSEGSQFDC